MRSFSEVSKSDLLFILYGIGDFKTKQEFFTFFNDVREQYCLNNGDERTFNTQRSQFHKWMEQGREIDPGNFSSSMATYVFESWYEEQADTSIAIKKLLATIHARDIDVSHYELELNDLIKHRTQKCEDPFKFDSLASRIVFELTFSAFNKNTTDAQSNVISTSAGPAVDESRTIPSSLTDKGFFSMSHVLHREELINKAESLLQIKRPDGVVQKTNILLTGFGGWGKTTIARVLYSKMLDSECYYSVGWIDYNIDLKNSFLNANAVKMFVNELDPEKRWAAIKKELLEKGSSQKKILLFIDNVDQKNDLLQFPKEDIELQMFADAPNINLVLTSRLSSPVKAESISGLSVPALSTEQCIDLFYHYWNEKKRRNDDVVNIEKLIAMAHHHTLAIKLLALGAKFQNLDEYVEETERIGFNFVVPEDGDDTIAATELRKLFDLKTRTERQLCILWDFSVLPQTSLDLREANSLLGYQIRDLEPLVNEGWLNYEDGFSLHPLIKTVIHMSLVNGSAPVGTMSHLFNLVENNALFTQTDSYVKILRTLSIVENALRFCNVDGNKVRFYYNLGMAEYEHARKRLTSLQYLGKAREEYGKAPSQSAEVLAEINYQLGYIESTTHKFRQHAHVELEASLSQWESLSGHEYEIDKAKDHLGYVLSDSAETQQYARKLLTQAYESRADRYKREKTRTNASDYATTCDNLGCLLMKCSPDEKETIQSLLSTAYNIRCKIYNRYGDNETEVAWTAFNIGDFLGNICNRNEEAEKYLRHALVIRREQDKKKPGAFTANIVFTLVALANVIKHDKTRSEEAKALLEEASLLQKGIDHEHSGFFLTPNGIITESFQKERQKIKVKESN